MTISVVVPIYNVSDYIERCVSSILRQTYTDFECIFVDDCSSDDSITKVHNMVDNYNGPISFRYLYHKRNRGLSAARNTATNVSQGKYIYYLDSDDEITPDCLSLLVKETETHPDVEVVQGGVTSIPYKEWYDLGYYKHPCYKEDNKWVRYNFFKYGEELPVNAWNKLVRKDVLINNKIRFKEGLIHEDELWTLQLVKKISKISIIGNHTYIHYATDNSIMSTMSKQRSDINWMYITRTAFRQIDKPYKRLQLYKYLWYFFDHIEYGHNTKEGFLAICAAAIVLLCSNHKKLAVQCLKEYFNSFYHVGGGVSSVKENIVRKWEINSQKQH